MSTEFSEDASLTRVLAHIMGDPTKHELEGLRENKIKVQAVLKTKVNNEGGHEPNSGPPVKLQKVSGIWQLYCDAAFLIVVDYYFYHHTDDIKRDALIFNALQDVEVTKEKDVIKFTKKAPELVLHTATLMRYGAFDTKLLDVRDWLTAATAKAAETFVNKHITGKLDDEAPAEAPAEQAEEPVKPRGRKRLEITSQEEEQPEPDEEIERPRVHSGVVDPEPDETPVRRGGRK